MAATYSTPGVYIKEVDAFPSTVVPVATAIPAFIGYTARADYKGKAYFGKAVNINSMNEFLIYFGVLDATGKPAPELAQHTPIYYPVAAPAHATGDVTIGGKAYDLLPDAGSIYHLYNSMRLFYANGGAECYVVSVGAFEAPAGKPLTAGAPLVNPNMALTDFMDGLAALELEPEPTMVVIPDSVLLKEADYATLLEEVLDHCGEMASRVAILDIYGGDAPDPLEYLTDIQNFRGYVGMQFLNFGAAYYPFLETTIQQDGGINFVNLGGGKALTAFLPQAATDPNLKQLLAQIPNADAPGQPTSAQIEKGLLNVSDDYSQLHDAVLTKINTLPPSAAIAGLYTMVDNFYGVWRAPANFSLNAVTKTTLPISDSMQGPLNIDPVTGKSINIIRQFAGLGTLVWGARTLDGNDNNWRYISVRRTLIMIEQSMKLAVRTYVFHPNVAGTWSLISGMLSTFLSGLWSQGALAGSSAAAAFQVNVGLGTTMTADDILNGMLRVSVSVAVSHPAEFIEISVSQQQQS